MAKFDASLDKEVFKETADFETTRINVGVFSYNDGPKKLQITRENLNPESGDWLFSKLGRLSKDQVEKVLPVIEKALKNM
ncbi:MAG: hypothetical protein ACOCXG_03820 [Nanoarchaeota archaeon]